MLWNLLGLQRKLDALFDDGWICLGIESGDARHLHTAGEDADTPQERSFLCADALAQPLLAQA